MSIDGALPATLEPSHPGLRLLAVLLEHGADLDATSVRGGTPREIFENSDHPLLTRLAK